MVTRQKLIGSLALVLVAASASAGPLVYVINGSQQFATIDLGTGVFQEIGPVTPGENGLAQGPNGTLLTITFSGDLDSINPATGVTSVIGPTGLADCSMPSSPCGPTSASAIGKFGGTIFATDFQNDLYTVNPLSGAATLIGPTGIPALPFIPMSINLDRSINVYDEDLFQAGRELYADFDAIALDPVTFTATPQIPANLYQIDPPTGHATLVAPTTIGLTAVVDVNGTLYAFEGPASQVVTLNVGNGNTSFVSNYDPALTPIAAAVPPPEPASLPLTAIGITGVFVSRRRRRNP